MNIIKIKVSSVMWCCLYFRIHFPDPHSRYRGSQISIIGGLENVFDARQRIMVGRERERGRENNTKHFYIDHTYAGIVVIRVEEEEKGRSREGREGGRERCTCIHEIILIVHNYIFLFLGLFASCYFI